MARAELEIPLGSGAKEMGLRPSVFVYAGAVFGLKDTVLTSSDGVCTNNTTGTRVGTEGKGKCPNGANLVLPPFEEEYVGETPSPRVWVGVGVNWDSPFGQCRMDIARALLK